MAQPLITIEGAGQLVRDLRRAGLDVSKELGQENKRIGEKVIRRAKPRAPHDEAPHMADTMRPSATARQVVVRMGGARSARYSPIVHWGSAYRPNTPAQPFIAQTAIAMEAELTGDYLDAVDRAVRKVSAD